MELVRSAVTIVPTCCFLNSSESLRIFPSMASGQQGGNAVALDCCSIILGAHHDGKWWT